MNTKTCSKCKETKPLGAFNKDRTRASGFHPQCTGCRTLGGSTYRAANKNKKKAMDATRYAANSIEFKSKNAARYAARLEMDIAARSRWAAENRDKFRTYSRAWKLANPEQARAQKKKASLEMPAWFVANQLGIPTAQLTPDLLELKRQQLEINRLNRLLHKTLKEKS